MAGKGRVEAKGQRYKQSGDPVGTGSPGPSGASTTAFTFDRHCPGLPLRPPSPIYQEFREFVAYIFGWIDLKISCLQSRCGMGHSAGYSEVVTIIRLSGIFYVLKKNLT